VGYLTNETVFDLPEAPASLPVIGGGPVGCQLAQAFARLGSRVTLVEAAPRLLPREWPQASQVVTAALTGDGVDVRTGVGVERVTSGEPPDGPARTR
jgi:pyruvate/2-oxoglutarate dehydrogenase complex dihydrolipoamide dehydrogenase (E3) component